MGKGWALVVAAVLLVGTVLVGAGSAAAGEGAEVPAAVEPAPITANGLRRRPVVEGHSFGFSVNVSSCLGPGLTLDHVTRVERPENARHIKEALVTAYLLHPAHREREKCLRVRRIRFARVRTKRPAAELVFFDGSSSPPRQIWPSVKSTPVRHRRSHSCGPATGTTLLAERKARIYSRGGSNPQEPRRPEHIYGCLVSTGHSIRLSPLPRTSRWGAPFMYGPLALDAPWAAGAVDQQTGRDGRRLSVSARNLQSGQIKSCLAGAGHHSPRSTGGVTSIALKRNGSLAWAGHARIGQSVEIGRQFPPREIVACDLQGERLLDSGPGIDLHSLSLQGSTLTWTDEGETRSATLN